jgi:hypothetical protein
MKIRFYIVQATGGARGDFLAGWLGSLPEFLNSNWTIDWETGQSFTQAKFLKCFHQGSLVTKNLRGFLESYQYVLDQNHDFLVAGTTHDASIANYVDPAQRDLVTILSIQLSQQRLIQSAWEFFVKTFLTKHRYDFAFYNHITYGVDHYLRDQGIMANDHERLKCIDQYLQNINLACLQASSVRCDYVFNYDELFVPEGSRHLVSQLDLRCSEKHHEQWNQNLKFAQSPQEIERFGRTFKFSEFRDSLQNQTRPHL